MTNSARNTEHNNANTGALFSNGSDMLGALLSGVWETASNAKYKLAISADVSGTRNIASLSKDGKLVSKGTVRAVKSRSAKAPAYRGNLGSLDIVLWNMGDYYQVRMDYVKESLTLRADAAAFLGCEAPEVPVGSDDSVPNVAIKENGPF